MTATPSSAYGGTIQRSTTVNGNVYEVIAYVVDLPDIPFEREEIDVTHTQSSGLWMEKIPDAVKSIGDMTFTILDSPDVTSHQNLYVDFNTDHKYGEMYNYRITEPDGSVLVEVAGFVKSISAQRKRGEAKLREITLAISGQPVAVNL